MSLNRPFFSIVMPTRDRAHLLKFALQSALSQTFDDYEILVSDNHSTDNVSEGKPYTRRSYDSDQ
jgi:glycosyltransferase involved in cell wall biosynthesis